MNNIEEVNDIYVGNIEEDIKTVVERVKTLNRHIKNYEKIDCKTEVYQGLVKEREAILNVLNRLKTLEKREKQAKEQIEEANRNLEYAIQILTDVKEY